MLYFIYSNKGGRNYFRWVGFAMGKMACEENERENQSIGKSLNSLTIHCHVCGKEFVCNKRYHTYKAYSDHKICYYCSYSCFNKRGK